MSSQQPQTASHQSKRIAKNSVLLFIRMGVLMIVNLYAVRILLKRLGVDDYGYFNAVAGVVTTLTCLSSVLSVSAQRFYSVATGKGDQSLLRKIFSTSVNINLILSLVILVVMESAGLWFLNTKLVIPADRIVAANWLFQFSLFTFICSLMQIPFTAAMVAHEDMGYYAAVSTVECLMKFGAAYMIGFLAIDKLVFYGMGLSVVALIVFITYALIGITNYSECRYQKVNEPEMYRKLFSFSGWTLFGALASVCMFQGNTILLNMFFPSMAVAAFAVVMQINNAFNNLGNSVVLAIRPVMIRSYAAGDNDYLQRLFFIGNKFLLYMFLAIGIPLIIEMHIILVKWLPEVNDMMVLFSQLIIVYVVLMVLHHPITILMQAAGLVKVYHLSVESITLLCLPVSYMLFRLHMPAYSSLLSMIGVCAIAHLVRLYCLHRYFPEFSLWRYLFTLITPAAVIALVVAQTLLYIHAQMDESWGRLFTVGGLSVVLVFAFAYLFGTSKNEKQILANLVTSVIKKRK